MSTLITGPGLDSAEVAPSIQRRSIEDPNQPLTAAQLSEVLFGASSKKLGGNITPESSKRITTVLACVRIISMAIARMPLLIYQRTKEGRERAIDHPYYFLLSLRPNLASTALTFIASMIANALLWGNAYAEIVRNRAGLVMSMHIIEPFRVRPYRRPGDTELTYEVIRSDGSTVTLLANEILHISGLSFNGIMGVSVIENARRALGLAEATTESAGYLAQQGLRPGGFLETGGVVAPDVAVKLKQDFDTLHSGPQNAGRVIVLPKGITFKSGEVMPPGDAQLVESRKMSRADIAEIFGVPLSMLGGIESAGNGNVEAASLDFLNYTLSPWIKQFELELNFKLFGESQQHYAEFLTQVILMMDAETRAVFYTKLRDLTAINGDEIRDRENMNRLPDGRGSNYFVPSNLMPAPTPAQADQLLQAWIEKTKKGGGPDAGGDPKPEPDGKVGGSTNNNSKKKTKKRSTRREPE